MNATMRRFAPIIAIIIGIVFIAVGVVKYSGTVSGSKTRTEVAEGTVVGLEEMESQDSDGFTDYTYAPVIDAVQEDEDIHFYTAPEVPPQLLELGRRTVKAFGVDRRFVHFEFIQLAKDYAGIGKTGEFDYTDALGNAVKGKLRNNTHQISLAYMF